MVLHPSRPWADQSGNKSNAYVPMQLGTCKKAGSTAAAAGLCNAPASLLSLAATEAGPQTAWSRSFVAALQRPVAALEPAPLHVPNTDLPFTHSDVRPSRS